MSTGQVIVAVLGGSGILGAVLSFFKLGKERDKLVVDAAQGLVTMSSDFAQKIKDDNDELRERNDQLEERVLHLERSMQTRVDELSRRIETQQNELNGALERERVLRAEITELRARDGSR